MDSHKTVYPSPDMTPEQLQKLLPSKSEDGVHFHLPVNFIPGSIAFANFPVRPNMRKQTTKLNLKRTYQSNWTQNEAKRIYVKKTMNLYHWTQPGLSTDFVRKIVMDSWDKMSNEEKLIYEKQGRCKPLHPKVSTPLAELIPQIHCSLKMISI